MEIHKRQQMRVGDRWARASMDPLEARDLISDCPPSLLSLASPTLRYWNCLLGQNSSVGNMLGVLSYMMQRRGFEPPLSIQHRVYFPLTQHGFWLHSLKLFRMRGLVCAHTKSITRTQKILTFMSWMSECRQQKGTQHAPSMKKEMWPKKHSHMQKSHQKWWAPDIAVNAEEEERTVQDHII